MKTSTREYPSASQKPMDESHANMADSAWKPLYRIGGVTALITAALAIIQIGL